MSHCDGNKSLDLDGSKFSFLKRFWNLFRVDLRVMFDQFHQFASLPHSLASYFLTLIPRVKSLSILEEFRVIYLVGSLYKHVSKVLAIILRSMMDKIISPNKLALLKGRMLVNHGVELNEAVYLEKKYKRACLTLMVDFKKEYDSIIWNFLDYYLSDFALV